MVLQRLDVGMWSSDLVRWLVRDFVRQVAGLIPSRRLDCDGHFMCPLAKVLKTHRQQSVPTMPAMVYGGSPQRPSAGAAGNLAETPLASNGLK